LSAGKPKNVGVPTGRTTPITRDCGDTSAEGVQLTASKKGQDFSGLANKSKLESGKKKDKKSKRTQKRYQRRHGTYRRRSGEGTFDKGQSQKGQTRLWAIIGPDHACKPGKQCGSGKNGHVSRKKAGLAARQTKNQLAPATARTKKGQIGDRWGNRGSRKGKPGKNHVLDESKKGIKRQA